MGDLTTFAIADPDPEKIVSSAEKLVDLLGRGGGFGQKLRGTIGKSRIRVFESVHNRDTTLYIQHGGSLHECAGRTPRNVREVVTRHATQMQEWGMAQESYLAAPQYAERLEDALLVATIYNDAFREIQNCPGEFAREIMEDFERLLTQDAIGMHSSFAQTELQKPLRADAEAIFISAGNTLVWFDANSPQPAYLKESSPDFYKDLHAALDRYRG